MTVNTVGELAMTQGMHEHSGVAIRFDNVEHAFVQGQTVVDAVGGVSLDILGGSFVSLIGPSGCGKTTLLNMVAGVVSPTHGVVTLGDVPVTGPSSLLSYMLARDALMPWRSVRGNVLVGLETRGTSKQVARRRADEWLGRVGLDDFGNAKVWQLSQGMRQRVALARTLALEPECVLMDEPFAAVDAQTRIVLQSEFLDLWARLGSTVMFVTHDIVESVLLSDRVILMSRRPGRVLLDVQIELPRPRSLDDLRGAPEFLTYVEEVSKTMAADGLGATPPQASSGEV